MFARCECVKCRMSDARGGGPVGTEKGTGRETGSTYRSRNALNVGVSAPRVVKSNSILN